METLVFDGHNDALCRLWCCSADPVGDFGQDIGHVNAPAAQAGGLGGGFFAIYSPRERKPFDFSKFTSAPHDNPLGAAIDANAACASAFAQAGIARQLHDAGLIRICEDAETLGRAFTDEPIAAVLHLEGADGIDPDLYALDSLHALGMRSLGLVWSRPTIFGQGVPFQFGPDGDTGPGLTDLGKRLVARCAALGIMVDTSHLNLKGFWDVAECGLPLVATHSNAYSICPTTRNLTDDQLRAIGQTGGVAGLNFGTLFLSLDGWDNGYATLDDCVRHLAHMVEMAGEDHVAIGSDFDGAPMPAGLHSAADLPQLVKAMEVAGFGEALIEKICHRNWLKHLGQVLG